MKFYFMAHKKSHNHECRELPCIQLPPIISHITLVHCKNQEIDVDKFVLTQLQTTFRFHQLLHAVQKPQFCNVGPTLEGREKNETKYAKLEPRTAE